LKSDLKFGFEGGYMPAAKKKGSSKKKAPTIAVKGHNIPTLKVEFPLDEKKIAAIQRCIAKGKLSLTLSRVDLSAGKIGEAWLYD
jgi:hypothetical protein